MTILVVTGTSTDVGKTVATAALAATAMWLGATVAVAKPAQTGVEPGEPADLADIRRLTGVTRTAESARFPDPLAPDVAARLRSMAPLELDTVLADARSLDADLVLVEGAGGLLVRLGEGNFTLLDVARNLGAPVIVVCGAELGTLNHTALTTSALGAAGVFCAGLIVGSWPADPGLAARTNLGELPDVAGAPVIGRIPAAVGQLNRSDFLAAAPTWFDVPALADIFHIEPADIPFPFAESSGGYPNLPH
ncbi:dethiobiotin synthase [Rhodococcus sp. G-MC3]|uniref:dethiobiotin synthase n=1 Tax=Rhodococcus sp. G-MC3 TaxID=3046209 RepID=UPI0024B98C76|nr:dethiobiotin synthase [Rhodococcus sp. G-MC3]MDJ0392103.1 dethiobiotin synthase [Rhodococcus sp. G-MC3]